MLERRVLEGGIMETGDMVPWREFGNICISKSENTNMLNTPRT
jgi:hypothetical protein